MFGTVGAFLVPLAGGGPVLAFLMLAGARLLDGLSDTIFVINIVSLRQTITPDRLQGRVNASVRSIADGMVPIGGILGGLLGEWLGLRPTLLAGAIGIAVSVVWLWCSPVRSLRDQPGQGADGPVPAV